MMTAKNEVMQLSACPLYCQNFHKDKIKIIQMEFIFPPFLYGIPPNKVGTNAHPDQSNGKWQGKRQPANTMPVCATQTTSNTVQRCTEQVAPNSLSVASGRQVSVFVTKSVGKGSYDYKSSLLHQERVKRLLASQENSNVPSLK